MAKTLTNLQTGTRTYLDEAQQTDFLDTEVNIAINFAYHSVIKGVIEVYEEFYATTTPFTYALVANQQEYTVDSTLIKITRVEINYTPAASNSQAIRAIPIKKDEVLGNLNNQNMAGSYFNAAYYLHGNLGSQLIGFIPVPLVSDTGNTKSISVWGIALPADLVNGTDSVNIPYADNFSQLINMEAASILLSKGQQDEASSNKYHLNFLQGIKDMQTFIKERQADGPWMIEDIMGEDTDFITLGFG